MFRVFKSPKFQKRTEKLLSKQEQTQLEKFIQKLKEGNILGKPLYGQSLKEFKLSGKRIYYLVYNDLAIILFVNASNKKFQQETINEIKYMLPTFKKYAYDLYKQNQN